MFYKYNLLHWFYVSMYIGSHHKLKDTFIVFKEEERKLPQVCCSAAIRNDIHTYLLVGNTEQLLLFPRTRRAQLRHRSLS